MSWVEYLIGIQSVWGRLAFHDQSRVLTELSFSEYVNFFKLLDKSYCISTAIFLSFKIIE